MSNYLKIKKMYIYIASQVAQVVKNLSASSGDARDRSSIPGLGRSSGEVNSHSVQYFTWRIPWAEETGGLQSVGSQNQTKRSAWGYTHKHALPYESLSCYLYVKQV